MKPVTWPLHQNDLPCKVPRRVYSCFCLCQLFSCFSNGNSIAYFRDSWLVIHGSRTVDKSTKTVEDLFWGTKWGGPKRNITVGPQRNIAGELAPNFQNAMIISQSGVEDFPFFALNGGERGKYVAKLAAILRWRRTLGDSVLLTAAPARSRDGPVSCRNARPAGRCPCRSSTLFQ